MLALPLACQHPLGALFFSFFLPNASPPQMQSPDFRGKHVLCGLAFGCGVQVVGGVAFLSWPWGQWSASNANVGAKGTKNDGIYFLVCSLCNMWVPDLLLNKLKPKFLNWIRYKWIRYNQHNRVTRNMLHATCNIVCPCPSHHGGLRVS